MEISQKLLCFLFLVSFTVGMVLGSIYDLFSFIRLLLGISKAPQKTSKKTLSHRLALPLTFCMDFCFSLFCGGVLILLLYFLNDGVFRFLSPLGLGCGIFTYRATLGRLIMRISEKLVNLIRHVISLALKAIMKPIRACIGLVHAWVLLPILRLFIKIHDRHMIKQTLRTTESFIKDAAQIFANEK